MAKFEFLTSRDQVSKFSDKEVNLREGGDAFIDAQSYIQLTTVRYSTRFKIINALAIYPDLCYTIFSFIYSKC